MEPDAALPNEPRRLPARRHPIACLFHVIFKLFIVGFWYLCSFTSFINSFIILLVFLSADFWTVKNVTGRLLVGLRWWNDVNEDGEAWRFEALDETQRRVNGSDKFVFWASLVAFLTWWIVSTFLVLVSVTKWKWLLICVIALMMTGSNLYGYIKCSREARDMIHSYTQSAFQAAATTAVAAAASTSARPSTSGGQ